MNIFGSPENEGKKNERMLARMLCFIFFLHSFLLLVSEKRKAASTEDISCIRLNDLSLPGS